MSLVRFHRLLTTALALALAAFSAWRGEAFAVGAGSPVDLILSVGCGLAAVGLVVYLARLNHVFHRKPGPGVPRDVG